MQPSNLTKGWKMSEYKAIDRAREMADLRHFEELELAQQEWEQRLPELIDNKLASFKAVDIMDAIADLNDDALMGIARMSQGLITQTDRDAVGKIITDALVRYATTIVENE
jgi:hypothetical protein